ncbi:hypothetical protein A3D77_04550 [Candidatus Gottesmanbacteria bacterium RIFCSPHIGHO2_02_FULL_39_11]|uniref:Asl1-like glycosyl hydrolase catalytic domain-containing protein n=1 Tax=Candidatus Gottesmanbacteria bacterium RIFCSPHIGHO2_02_FULL_39_11 TaxID=1798382 RepID=A0A1F5ZKG1_9BACT|nr:MAG: hypothetical protein A3D77_04550 [Candidatus Gottesmanbacteria bacterium RIFCSPHIGHO2_02_FULL_39_11]
MSLKKTVSKKIGTAFILLFALLYLSIPQTAHAGEPFQIWNYQCIDTMKTSRDRARQWAGDPHVESLISKEVTLVKNLGANCIAISTPYNEEFIPYLKIWSEEAHKQNLSVWFRGNFAEWEGWFEYPKNLTPEELLTKTAKFIASHSDLFKDGDAFDSCPECEGVGPWLLPRDTSLYLSFKIKQQEVARAAFKAIGKNIITNRLAVIGGRAKDYYDLKTAEALGNLVVIDHYVKTVDDMKTYVEYFDTKLKSKTFIGEFGAPIPDINGRMNETQQADFVESIFDYLYRQKNKVDGVNYWVLSDGTTALVNDDYTPKEVFSVIEKYYKPGQLTGTVKNSLGEEIAHAQVDIGNGEARLSTDSKGSYKSAVIKGKKSVEILSSDYISQTGIADIEKGKERTLNFVLIPKKKSVWYNIREFLHNL